MNYNIRRFLASFVVGIALLTLGYIEIPGDVINETKTVNVSEEAPYETESTANEEISSNIIKSVNKELLEDMVDNYLQVMIDSCTTNDRVEGLSAETARNELISTENLSYEIIYYDDLYLLSKIISWESGSSWLSDEHQLYVGNVLLNRVNSPEFPDSIYDCIHQESQYADVNSDKFRELNPAYDAVNNAADLLSGNRYLPDSVVFQSEFPQGSGVYETIYDNILGTTTYFCHSSNLSLYEE